MSTSSQSLEGAAEAENKALQEGGGGGGSSTTTRVEENLPPESFTYYPGPDDPKTVFIGGKEFKEEEAVEVEDPKLIRKLRGNPAFMEPEERQKQYDAHMGATDFETIEANRRAAQAEQDLKEAEEDPDKDIDVPINTRVPEVPQHQRMDMQQHLAKLVKEERRAAAKALKDSRAAGGDTSANEDNA